MIQYTRLGHAVKNKCLLTTLILISLTFLYPDCSSNEAQPPVLRTDNQWVYSMVAEGDIYDVTITMAGEEVIDGKSCYAMDWYIEPEFYGIYSKSLTRIDRATNFPVKAGQGTRASVERTKAIDRLLATRCPDCEEEVPGGAFLNPTIHARLLRRVLPVPQLLDFQTNHGSEFQFASHYEYVKQPE